MIFYYIIAYHVTWYYIVLHHIAIHHIISYCIELYYIIIYYIILYYIISYYIILYYMMKSVVIVYYRHTVIDGTAFNLLLAKINTKINPALFHWKSNRNLWHPNLHRKYCLIISPISHIYFYHSLNISWRSSLLFFLFLVQIYSLLSTSCSI